MVAATIAAEPKEIPMRMVKSKRNSASSLNVNQQKGRNSAVRKSARKPAEMKPDIPSLVDKRAQSSSLQNGKADSKKSRVLAMLRAPSGTTIDALAQAMKWQRAALTFLLKQ